AVEDTDEFEINVSDPRFTALHESHHFAIDPTNPQFKKTKSMSKLLEERQRRQVTGNEHSEDQVKPSNDQPKSKVKDASISRLVDSIKRKSTSNVASSGKRKKSSK
ncbi:pre-rRNA-processing protein esf1, partial [Basidiobolus ranarum]